MIWNIQNRGMIRPSDMCFTSHSTRIIELYSKFSLRTSNSQRLMSKKCINVVFSFHNKVLYSTTAVKYPKSGHDMSYIHVFCFSKHKNYWAIFKTQPVHLLLQELINRKITIKLSCASCLLRLWKQNTALKLSLYVE